MSSKQALQQTRLQKTNIYNVPSDELKNMYYEIVRNKNLRLSKNVNFCATVQNNTNSVTTGDTT